MEFPQHSLYLGKALGLHQALWELGISLPLGGEAGTRVSDSAAFPASIRQHHPGPAGPAWEGGRGIGHPDSGQLSVCSFFLFPASFPKPEACGSEVWGKTTFLIPAHGVTSW